MDPQVFISRIVKLGSDFRYPSNIGNIEDGLHHFMVIKELQYKEENKRDGDLKYSYEEIRELIPDYDTYTKEEQDYLLNEQKLMDLEELYDIATIQLKRVN